VLQEVRDFGLSSVVVLEASEQGRVVVWWSWREVPLLYSSSPWQLFREEFS
jgi:hypothetical protein